MTKKLIGYIGVDSGQLMMCDPCYIDSLWRKVEGIEPKEEGEFTYAGACDATLTGDGTGILGKGIGVAFKTAFGDGQYAVFAEFDRDGIIERVIVELQD